MAKKFKGAKKGNARYRHLKKHLYVRDVLLLEKRFSGQRCKEMEERFFVQCKTFINVSSKITI